MRLVWTVLFASTLGFAASALAQGQPESGAGKPPAEGAGAAAAPAGAEEAPSGGKTKLFVGGGLGGGIKPQYKVNGRTITFSDRLQGSDDKTSPIAANVTLGVGLSPHVYLGGDISTVLQAGKSPVATTALQITNYIATLTYFPWETGLFLRAGAGLSVLTVAVDSSATNNTTTDRSAGFGFLLGVGFAASLSGPHHVSLTFEQSWQTYGGSSSTKAESSQFGAVFLGYMYKN